MVKGKSGRVRLLDYLRAHTGEWIHNQTLRDEAQIDDVPRAIRQLKQDGWRIAVRGDGYNSLESGDQGPSRGTRSAISQKIRYLVLQKCQFRCRACGRGAEDGVKLVIDHLLPVDWGGDNSIDNLQALCEGCNQGKQAWVEDLAPEAMRDIFGQESVERRIEALFKRFPNQDVPSLMIQMVSHNALDWQRALRRVRSRTGMLIKPTRDRTAYRYST